MDYMFNELSLSKVNSIGQVYIIMESIVRSYIRAREMGFEEIRLHETSLTNLYSLPLCEDYNIDAWLNDNNVDSDLRLRFREIITSCPLIRENEFTENEEFERSEFFKSLEKLKHQVWGLGAAYIYDTLCYSLPTINDWMSNRVIISHFSLDDHLQESTTEVEVKHFSSVETLITHSDWWENYQTESLGKSAELWARRVEFFPNLEFCEEVESQLKKLGVSKMLFQIIDRLRALNNYARSWEQGNFSYEDVNQNTNLRISPESATTLSKYGSLRKFYIPNRGKTLFDLHIKTGDLRFHFYPDNSSRRIYIGYIGKHLRIASEG